MAVPTSKKMIRGRAKHPKKSHTSHSSTQSHVKRTRTQGQVKYRGARISRARLRSLRDDLAGTRNAVSDLHENFWLTSGQDIREMLAKTQHKIARAIGALERAA